MANRLPSQTEKDAASAKELLSVDLLKISFGCTDGTYTDQASCELNGETWTDDILVTTYVTDLDVDVGSGVEIFESAKDLLELPEIEDSLSMNMDTLPITFSGVSGKWLQLTQEIEIMNRPVEIWRMFLDPFTRLPKGLPFKTFTGSIVDGGLKKTNIGGGSVVTLEASNQYYNFHIIRGILCNVDSHQQHYPNDTGFKFTSSVPRELTWGKK